MTSKTKQRRVTRMGCYDEFHVQDDGWRIINGEELDDDQFPEVGPWIIENLRARRKCPYCRSPLRSARQVWGDYPNGGNCKEWVLVCCKWCALWQFFCKHGLMDDFPSRIYWEAYLSKARTFSEVLPEGCESELAQVLRRDKRNWALIEPKRLELFVADILRANYGHCEVTHMGKPNDGGIDVLLIDSEQNQWLVQVKRRSGIAGEPVATIRNLLGVMYSEGTLRGIVVSTANHFTYWAQELRRKVQNKGCLIDLVDRGKLDLMLDPLIPVRPWSAIYDEYIHGWGDDVPDGRAVFDLLEKRLGCPRTEAKKSQ